MNKIDKLYTVSDVEAYRKEINEACDARVKHINTCLEANELSKKSFGYIKEAFEAISPELFTSKEGKKLMKKYADTIRGSKSLSALHTLYESIRKANNKGDVRFLVEQIADVDWLINKEELEDDTEELGRTLAEAYILVNGKELPEEDKTFHSAVSFIAENKKGKKNLAEYSEAVKVIKEHIEKKEGKSLLFQPSLEDIVKTSLKEFNEKYNDKLTKEDIAILNEVSSSEDKEQLFNKYKTQCTEKIAEAKKSFDEKGDANASKRLSVVLEQVEQKKYSSDTINQDICALINLSKIF